MQLEQLHTGLTRICDISHCDDDRLFLTLQAGTIRIRTGAGVLLTPPFLDIIDRVNDGNNEQGLLGLAFPPDYATSGLFYVHYTAGTGNGSSRISRFSVTADPNVADPSSEVILYTRSQPATNHNGGDIDFGPDGYLYAGFGDGGSGNDPWNNAQNMNTALGKIIRIDVSGPTGWTVPPSNPFATATDTLREIWASGLRNPWRWGFDRLTGDMWIGDVGQNAVEEVDFWPAGDNSGPNFGWRCYEGNNNAVTTNCLPLSSYVAPVAVHIQNSQNWCSVIGGRVYRGDIYWRIEGRYIYTDYCGGQFYSLKQDAFGAWVRTQLLASGVSGFSCIGENSVGELFAGTNNNGRLYRIKEPCTAQPPVITPDGSTLISSTAITYQWYLNGTILSGATAQSLVPAVVGNYHVLATVNTGCVLSSDTLFFTTLSVVPASGSEIIIRPIPADEVLRVDGDLPIGGRIQLFDPQGRTVLSLKYPGSGSIAIPTYDLVSGQYILELTGQDGRVIMRRNVTIAH